MPDTSISEAPHVGVPVRVLFAAMTAAVLVLAVSVVPGVRPGPGVVPVYDDVVQPAGYLLAAAAVVWRAVAVPTDRLLWSLVATSLALRAYGFAHLIFVLDRSPDYPSLADLGWILSAVVLIAALLVAARGDRPVHGSRVLALDALLAGATAAAVATTLLYPTLRDLTPQGTPTAVLVTNLAYPVLDVALLVVLAGLLALSRGRLPWRTGTVSAGIVLFAVVDVWFLVQVTAGTFRPGSVLAPLALLASVVIAAAAWLPGRRAELPGARPVTLTTPVVLAVVNLLVLVYDTARPVPRIGELLAVAGVLLAILRTGVSFAGDRRLVQATLAEKDDELVRFRALVDASADFIGIGTLTGEITYVNPAGRDRIGLGRDEPLDGLTIGDTLYEEERRRAIEVERPQIMQQGFWRGESTLRHQRGGADTPVMKSTFLVRRATGEPWLLSTIQRDISELRQAQADLQRLADERQELLRHLVTAQESERSRIAADVHDDSVQTMAAVDLQLGLLQRRLELDAGREEVLATVRDLRSTVGHANDRLRYLLFDLDSPAERDGLVPALEEAAAYVLGPTLRWRVRGEDRGLTETSRVLAYRIAKEAMVNVVKHAQARTVDIAVRTSPDGVEVVVADDGRGLPPEGVAAQPGHRGVSDMRDRAAVAGGTVEFADREGGGTRVRLWIPGSADLG